MLIVALVVVLVGAAAYYMVWDSKMSNTRLSTEPVADQTVPNNDRRMGTSTPPEQPNGKLKVANFSGKLEKVDVGCFADGECYVEVGGKHVTAILGWRQEVVGSVQGVEGFGDLEKHIGEEVEVYAQDKGDGTYTLYGSEEFYIKLK